MKIRPGARRGGHLAFNKIVFQPFPTVAITSGGVPKTSPSGTQHSSPSPSKTGSPTPTAPNTSKDVPGKHLTILHLALL